MTKENKKYLMTIATLMILIFHVWIPVFSYGSFAGDVERFLISSSYIGVDIFFFVSAYSLSSRPVWIFSIENNRSGFQNYINFIINRAIKLIPLFLIAWAFGHFMWFIPSLMIVYLVFPPVYRLCEKKPWLSLAMLFIGWAGLVWLIMGAIKPHDDIGIFLFRIPIVILGAYAAKFDTIFDAKFGAESSVELSAEFDAKFDAKSGAEFGAESGVELGAKSGAESSDGHIVYIEESKVRIQRIMKLLIGISLLAIGIFLTYGFGYIDKLNFPFKGAFYLVGIPVTVGLSVLISLVGRKNAAKGLAGGDASTSFERFIKKPIFALANASLETYFMQMILGSTLVGTVFSLTGSKPLTNILVMAVIILLAILLSKIYPKIVKFLKEL